MAKFNLVLRLAALIMVYAPPALACSRGELLTFIAAAQVLEPKAVADGQRLMHCSGQADQAVQWQAFLLDQTGNHAASLKIDAPLAARSGRDGVIARAQAGTYDELLNKIDQHDPAYATAADAQLVLARVLTRKGRFSRGREAYQMYLKVRPDDDDAETERLYSFIWEGNWTQADTEFRGAQRWSAKAEFKAALTRGRTLIGSHASGTPANDTDEGQIGDQFQASYGLYRIPSSYDRRTFGVVYQGPVDLRLAAHTIKDLGLTQAKMNANEFSAGAVIGRRTSWYLAAHGGYFSLGSDHYTGDASLGVPLGSLFLIEGGAAETPLALSIPLSPDAAGLMRDSVFVQLSLARFIQLHMELQKEKNYKPHESHSLLGRLPLRQKDAVELAVLAAFTYASYPQPIADYDTALRTLTAGAGFAFDRGFAAGWHLDTQAIYSLAFVTQRDQARHTKQVGVFDATANLSVPMGEMLHALVSSRYVRAQDDEFVRLRHLSSSLLLGIGYGEGDRH